MRGKKSISINNTKVGMSPPQYKGKRRRIGNVGLTPRIYHSSFYVCQLSVIFTALPNNTHNTISPHNEIT